MRVTYHQQLAELTTVLSGMCDLSGQLMARATAALLSADLAVAERVISDHADIVALSAQAESAAFGLLARQSPVAGELRLVVGAFRVIADIDRMGSLALHVAKMARRRHPATAVPADVAGYFGEMGRLAVHIATETSQLISSENPGPADRLQRDDDAMDDIHRHLFTVLIDRDWGYGVQAAVDITLLSRYYERFADHAVQIGVQIAQNGHAR